MIYIGKLELYSLVQSEIKILRFITNCLNKNTAYFKT